VGALSAAPAVGQTLEGGLKAGLSFANVHGDDIAKDEASILRGFTGGGFLMYRATSIFAVQPEVSFVRKGAKTDFEVEGINVAGQLRLDYVEVPILIKLMAPMKSDRAPRFAALAGPVLAFKTGCEAEITLDGDTFAEDCDEGEEPIEVKTTDFGVAFGAAVGFPIARARLWLDGRYVLGLTRIDDSVDAEDVKNYNYALTAGFSIPLWNGPRTVTALAR
jgi:hypothetical protein